MGSKQLREILLRKYKLLNIVPSGLETHDEPQFAIQCSLFREKFHSIILCFGNILPTFKSISHSNKAAVEVGRSLKPKAKWKRMHGEWRREEDDKMSFVL